MARFFLLHNSCQLGSVRRRVATHVSNLGKAVEHRSHPGLAHISSQAYHTCIVPVRVCGGGVWWWCGYIDLTARPKTSIHFDGPCELGNLGGAAPPTIHLYATLTVSITHM